MTTLNKLSIPQLIARLSSLGIEWVGSTTRKQPLVELVAKLESLPEVRSESDLPSTMRFVSAPVDSYTWEQLVLIWRHFNRGPLMSYEVLDRDTMWAKVKALLCSLPGRTPVPAEPLPSLDKLLSTDWSDLNKFTPAMLKHCCKLLGLSTYYSDKREVVRYMRATLAGMRRRPERDLVFDPAGCQYVYESKTGFQFKIAEDMWENPTKPLYHALVLQDLKERGFYEPDCVTDALHGLYLVCDLADAPVVKNKNQFVIGDKVTLKEGEPNIKIEPPFWFHPGDKGEVIGMVGEDICRIETCIGGEMFYFLTKQSSLKPCRP